ncbi:MAG: Multi-sensor signal transduction histidine kinase [Ktedonobacterales bacterium]|nr:MAG: Multi-sensor signal transduction histidine kinase [Ktedonobacterales bacterium]
MRASIARTLAWGLWSVDVALVITAGVFFSLLPITPQDHFGALTMITAFSAFPLIGAIIVSRRWQNAVGWIFCVLGVGSAITSVSAASVQYLLINGADNALGTRLLDTLGNTVWPINVGLGILLLLLFPNGKPSSARWRLVVWLDVAGIVSMSLSSTLMPGPQESGGRAINPLGIPGAKPLLDVVQLVATGLVTLLVLAAVLSLIVRYRQTTREQRQQIKWFVFGAILMVGLVAVSAVLIPESSYLSNITFGLGVLMLPLGAGIGVLKYRLYDIDVIINRALVYGSLTLILALVYIGGVIGMQRAIDTVTHQQSSPVAIVITTLVIAALFQPLRRRIQTFIDRRFYRGKYDAAKTVAQFSAVVRSEVSLSELSEHLVAVVEETMQPAHVSLWLKPTETRHDA